MRQIKLESLPRREHFEAFRTFDYPHFSLCANVDLTKFYRFIRQHDIPFNIATIYVIAKAANAIPEFRYRIRENTIIEHESVHPASTIMSKNDVFSFCKMEYSTEYSIFEKNAKEKIARVKERPRLFEENQDNDNLLFMTAIPWVSFTSFMHPLHLHPVDSVPRFAWGKYFRDGESMKMPLSVQGHHAVMDGLHMGRFYVEVQKYFDQPGKVLGKV